MKRLVLVAIVILMLGTLTIAGCAEKETQPASEEVVSSCVTCHTDKDTLKEVAAPEPEEAKSEATTGEG